MVSQHKIQEMANVYNTSTDKIEELSEKFPPFSDLNHHRVLREAIEVYGKDNRSIIISCIFKFPKFSSYNHDRVLSEAIEVYGEENRSTIISCILKFPQFSSLNHDRVLREAMKVYGKENRSTIISCILKYPPFSGLNHHRVLKQKYKLGKLLGLTINEVIDVILVYPVLAGYSYKRDIAVFDIMKRLAVERQLPNDKEMLNIFLNKYALSPYVSGYHRLRMGKVEKLGKTPDEPKMMKQIRKHLDRRQLVKM